MNRDYARHYARFHPDTSEHDANLRALLQRWLGPHLPADPGAAILDVGCGRGYALALLRELGYMKLEGIDSDAGQVTFARRRGLPVTLVADTVAHLRAGGPSYDLVLLMDVLEHIPATSRAEFLQTVAGSLRPGGRLICTVPNAASMLAGYWRYVDPTHHTLFTVQSLDHALHQSGLETMSIQPVEFTVRPRYLFWWPGPRTLLWWLRCLVRLHWRMVQLAELGWEQGRHTPVGPNLLAVARRD